MVRKFKGLCGSLVHAFLLLSCFLMLQPASAYETPVDRGIDVRVVGGEESEPDSRPWVAALIRSNVSAAYGQYCGGALVAPKWVVTAAHCAENRRPSEIDVVLNRHDLRVEAGERISVDRIILHPDYEPDTLDADLALLRLVTASKQDSIEIIPQGDPDDLTLPGKEAVVLGWGKTKENGSSSDVLREVAVPLVELDTARNAFESYGFTITENMMAAGVAEGGRDACHGDSGGPMVVPNAAGCGLVLAGVTSWGLGCARPDMPGMYTRLSRFSGWIHSYARPSEFIPVAPTDIAYPAEDVDGDFTVLWRGVENAGKYELQRSESSDFSQVQCVYMGEKLFYHETGLMPGSYYYRVRAGNNQGFGDWREGKDICINPQSELDLVAVHRFRNEVTGRYIMRTESEPAGTGWTDEGVVFLAAPAESGVGTPVHRLINTRSGAEYYTVSEEERDDIGLEQPEYVYGTTLFNAFSRPGSNLRPVFKFYNAAVGSHFFTASEAERDIVVSHYPQFTVEGVTFYVFED